MSGISVNNGRLERDRSVGIYPLVPLLKAMLHQLGASADHQVAEELAQIHKTLKAYLSKMPTKGDLETFVQCLAQEKGK